MGKKSATSAAEFLGNTKPKTPKKTKEPKKKEKEVLQYCFTLNNWNEEEYNNLIKSADLHKFEYVIGKEIGDEEETPHLQGYIKMPKKHSWSAMCKLLGNKRLHIEGCKGSRQANIDYCTKEGNWVSNIEDIKITKKKKPIKYITPNREYQKFILDIISKEPNERDVYWFYESVGNVGKSQFSKYLVGKHDAIYIDEGKKSDIVNLIYNKCKADIEIELIVFDIPRNNGNKISYKAIETLKNGLINNTKYETGNAVFNAPHIIVFSNYYPETKHLSKDRWKIYEINADFTYTKKEVENIELPEDIPCYSNALDD